MPDLALATIAFNEPRLIAEQIRLLRHLGDDYHLRVYDASTDETASWAIGSMLGMRYVHLTTSLHHEALNAAAADLLTNDDSPYIGFLDHDVFPVRPTSLIPLIEDAGFLGLGQRHPHTGHLYLWPGFCFFSREWLAGRPLDFEGIRGERKRDDGDTGSGLWPLFQGEEWEKMYRLEHGYRPIREPDGYGLQSWGVEWFGDWLHLSNGSGWMNIPDPEGRRRLTYELLAAL